MAPSPEYDKEPKAPDKSVTTISNDESKVLYNIVKEPQAHTDHKPTVNAAVTEVENNKHVETLDDGQLRALLDEAITYKCPKDREGKSSLFKELLEEVEQDEQACEAAARGLSVGRGRRARGRREHQSNSLQDLVAAMAAEPAPRRRAQLSYAPAPPAPVSARTLHGGSLPSGVDTSFLLSEEPHSSRGGYLATVRCVNPPPLAERRVSASDANGPADLDQLARRSKPMFPMTYTTRASLEIGSGSVCSGRAVTTTTASNQVLTRSLVRPRNRRFHPNRNLLNRHQMPRDEPRRIPPTRGPPERVFTKKNMLYDPEKKISNQTKLMSALCLYKGENNEDGDDKSYQKSTGSPPNPNLASVSNIPINKHNEKYINYEEEVDSRWRYGVNNWYETLETTYSPLALAKGKNCENKFKDYQNVRNTNYQIRTEFNNASIGTFTFNRSKRNLNENTPKEFMKNDKKNYSLAEESKVNKSNNEQLGDDYSYKNRVINSDISKGDIRLREDYRKRIGNYLVPPKITNINPKYFKNVTIGKANYATSETDAKITDNTSLCGNKRIKVKVSTNVEPVSTIQTINDLESENKVEQLIEYPVAEPQVQTGRINKVISENKDIEMKELNPETHSVNKENETNTKLIDLSSSSIETSSYIELEPLNLKTDFGSGDYDSDVQLINNLSNGSGSESNSFLQYVAAQEKLLANIKAVRSDQNDVSECIDNENLHQNCQSACDDSDGSLAQMTEIRENNSSIEQNSNVELSSSSTNEVITFKKTVDEPHSNRYILAELFNDAYIFLTVPESPSTCDKDTQYPLLLKETYCTKIDTSNNSSGSSKRNKKKNNSVAPLRANSKKSNRDKNTLRMLLYSEGTDKAKLDKNRMTSINNEVDSAIPFSCITTPEVVASCNTTSSSAQLGTAVDPKPRSVISSSFNGLPLARTTYGSTASTAGEEYKKSIDENGNSVQGFTSPVSGSSQHKKPRRKKSSKNETVIKSHQIDGYQGNKDLNEVLRFIESNADSARGHKLGRAKHKDDSDDKAGKKRSTERRKDKENKMKRASSLEELSRTTLEDLTDKPARRPDAAARWPAAPAKAERRSWGDDARHAFYFRDAPALDALPPDAAAAAAAAELTDFQTVTKKRKPRRRADDAERDPAAGDPPPRRARPPSPRPRRESAPPSDRSNDSNDDMDSVHSLPADSPPRPPPAPAAPPPPPAPPAPPAPAASYADIARTRHNIPDLIESCNFYAEGESEAAATTGAAGAGDADGYPALSAARRRDKPPPPAPARPSRKERPETRAPDPPPPAPAPDVVADRRPPVILLDSPAKPRDMDGVTFGFDINEQLLGRPARRARLDLLRDAEDAAAAVAGASAGADAGAAAEAAAGDAVAVRAGCAALHYVPPDPPPDTHHLHQIIDYVGNAWEEVVRSSGSKVRYFSE